MASEFNKLLGSLHVIMGQACPRSPASDTGVPRATHGGACRCVEARAQSPGAGLSWCCPQVTSRSLWNTGGTRRCSQELRGQKPVSEASSGEGRASRGFVG